MSIISSSHYGVQFEDRCQIPKQKLEMFDKLFGEFLPIASIPDITHLQISDEAKRSIAFEKQGRYN